MFFTIYGSGGNLGHVTWISRSKFPYPYPWMLHIKFQFDWPCGFRKKIFEKCVFLHLPLFRSQAAIVFKKSIIFTFSHVKAYVSKIDLAVKQVKVILGSSFYQTMVGCSPKCYIPSFVKIGLPVQEKKIFEWFLPYMGVAAILIM